MRRAYSSSGPGDNERKMTLKEKIALAKLKKRSSISPMSRIASMMETPESGKKSPQETLSVENMAPSKRGKLSPSSRLEEMMKQAKEKSE